MRVKKNKVIPTCMKKNDQKFEIDSTEASLCTLSPKRAKRVKQSVQELIADATSDSDSDSKSVFCDTCNKSVKKSYLSKHIKTKSHVNKL
jgi:hypothetical protein